MGVAHLAYTLANQIYQLQGNDLGITRSDVKCAEVAGELPHLTKTVPAGTFSCSLQVPAGSAQRP